MSWPLSFDGGLFGALFAVLITALLIWGSVALDRLLIPWLGRMGRSPSPVLQRLSRRPLLVRLALFGAAGILALTAYRLLSPILFWLLLPTLALALGLALAAPLRDLIVGTGQALSRRIQPGETIAVDGREGRVIRADLRGIVLRRTDNTEVEVPWRLISNHGLRRLRATAGGHPVAVEVPLSGHLALDRVMEEARLAALLAPHAHLGAQPTVTLAEHTQDALRILGVATSAQEADRYRAEVSLAYRAALDRLAPPGAPPATDTARTRRQ